MVAAANVPIEPGRSVPIAIIGHIMPSSRLNKRRRITAREIEELALEAFDKGKRWITFQDVRDKFGIGKQKSQRKLKDYCDIVIFAPGNYKPQRYYPIKLSFSQRYYR